MSINLTDELLAKTKKGKIASAKQVFLEGDTENLQQIGDKTHQLEDTLNTKHESLSKTVQGISATGKANTATEVTYNNTNSGITAENIQDAVDRLAAKDATKAEKSDVNNELAKKFDKESISQESGEAEDKVMSQKTVSSKLSDLSKNISNFMAYPYSNIFEDFKVLASTKYDFYLRKITKQAITIGYISDNETYSFIEPKIKEDGSFSQLSNNGVYIHGKVNVNNIKEESTSVVDVETAKARRINYYQGPKKSVLGSNPILDLVFDEIYLDRDIDKSLYLRNASQTNISLGTELNGVTSAIDLKRIKYQVVSIDNAKVYVVLSDDFIKGNYDWMDIRGANPEYYKFDVDVIRNIEYAQYIKSGLNVDSLSSYISNFMAYPYSNIFEDFKVLASTKYDFYLRKITKQAITIGYISDNETYSFIEPKIKEDGSFSQLSNNGVYIHGKVNVNNIKEESTSVVDVETAKARRINYYQGPKKSVLGSNPILDLVFDEIYLDRDIDKSLYLRNASQTNISLGTELNGVTSAIDLKRIKYQVVSIDNAKVYVVLSDDFIKGNYDWMDIRGANPEYYKFDVDVIRNIEYAQYIKIKQSSKETDAMYDFSENEDSISLFTRILNSRKTEKEIEENKILSVNGSDASFCLDDSYIYITYVVDGKSNDVYYGEGSEVALSINSKSDGSEIKTLQIAQKGMTITLDDGKEVTLQRGASMPNIIREGTNIYILYCTMIDNLFVLMRCCVDSASKTISSYSVCKLNGEDFNTNSIKKCGGIYSTDSDVSINVNARFADSKDTEGNYYVGVCAADKLTYPLIAKTKDFKSFSSFMFLECRNMNAAYECTTAIREKNNKLYLYAVTRQQKLIDGYKYIILNCIDIEKKEIISARNISASDSRPCLFLHRNGAVLLAYNLPSARNRVRITQVEQSGESSILLDFSYKIAGYINFERSMSEVKYYCNGAIAFENGQGGQIFSFTSLDTIKKEKTESIIDTWINA